MRDVVALKTGVVVISAVVVDSMVAIVKMVVEVPLVVMVVILFRFSLHLESSSQGPSHQADVEEEDWKTNAGNANLEVH